MIKSAEEIFKKHSGHAHGLMFEMCYEAMKEYTQQFIEDIADEVNQWENSGQMREDILEIFNPQNK